MQIASQVLFKCHANEILVHINAAEIDLTSLNRNRWIKGYTNTDTQQQENM